MAKCMARQVTSDKTQSQCVTVETFRTNPLTFRWNGRVVDIPKFPKCNVQEQIWPAGPSSKHTDVYVLHRMFVLNMIWYDLTLQDTHIVTSLPRILMVSPISALSVPVRSLCFKHLQTWPKIMISQDLAMSRMLLAIASFWFLHLLCRGLPHFASSRFTVSLIAFNAFLSQKTCVIQSFQGSIWFNHVLKPGISYLYFLINNRSLLKLLSSGMSWLCTCMTLQVGLEQSLRNKGSFLFWQQLL